MMARRLAVVLAAALLMAPAADAQGVTQAVTPARAQPPAQSAAEAFPHAKHAKVAPTCNGCHEGVPTGDAARTYPAVASCAACHDGTIQKTVTWSPPARRGAGLLVYSHPAHGTKAKDATCESCHANITAPAAPAGQPRATAWMDVGKAAPELCLACHDHRAPSHLDEANKCTTCHRPLVEATALSDARVVALPKPPSHDGARFVSAHGDAARASGASCATCHARESCTRCHVDGARNATVRALAPDARVARAVAGKAPSYPTPVSHTQATFRVDHGAAALAEGATCATCHARPSCQTCHAGDGARAALRGIPTAREAAAPGVTLRRAVLREPLNPPPVNGLFLATARTHAESAAPDTGGTRVRVHPAGFARSHGAEASSGALQCSSCHAQATCTSCHAGERTVRRFHPANFVASHAPQAYGRDTDCAACHNTQAFCRSCHLQAGLAVRSSTQRSTTYHNAVPLWLLQHGRAARQDLPSCTTCHQQTYCMQCHSQLGARINPHGSGFDAARMSDRNSRICLACHFTNPVRK